MKKIILSSEIFFSYLFYIFFTIINIVSFGFIYIFQITLYFIGLIGLISLIPPICIYVYHFLFPIIADHKIFIPIIVICMIYFIYKRIKYSGADSEIKETLSIGVFIYPPDFLDFIRKIRENIHRFSYKKKI